MTASSQHLDRPFLGMLLRLASMAILATMFMLVKYIDQRDVHIAEILFFRFLTGAILLGIWMRLRGELRKLRTQRLRLHLARTGGGVIGAGFNFWAITLLPMAEAAILNFTVPLISTILSAVILSEFVGIKRSLAVVLGFVGVVIAIQPGQNAIPLFGALIGLSGAFCSSVNTIITKSLSTSEGSSLIVFYYMFLALPILACVLPFVIKMHAPSTYCLLILLGFMGAVGLVLFTESLRFATVSVLAPFDYSYFLFATFYGWLIWENWPGNSVWWGLPFIVGAGLFIAMRQRQNKKPSSNEASKTVMLD